MKTKRKEEVIIKEFEAVVSDILCHNKNASAILTTLRSITKKLLKDDDKYRTLDLTNVNVMNRLINFECVMDFLRLLGFETRPDATAICTKKPQQSLVRDVLTVLNSYSTTLRVLRKDDHNDCFQLCDEADDELTLKKIIEFATDPKHYDNDITNVVILTYRKFTDSVTLMKQMKKRFMIDINNDIMEQFGAEFEMKHNAVKRIHLKVIKMLRDWMKQYWMEDFYGNEGLQNELDEWIETLSTCHALNEYKHIPKVTEVIKKQIDEKRKQSIAIEEEKHTNDIIESKQVMGKEIREFDNCTEVDLANQITLMDWKLFTDIKPKDWIHDTKTYENTAISLALKRHNNLVKLIQMKILTQTTLRNRRKMIKKCIRIGEEMRERHNYQSLNAIYCALTSAAIHRLNVIYCVFNTKESGWTKKVDEWRDIFDYRHTFIGSILMRLMRDAYALNKPCIPCVTVLLNDIVRIDCENECSQGIDMEKYIRIAQIIGRVQYFQSNGYKGSIEEDSGIEQMLLGELEKYKDVTEDEIMEFGNNVRNSDIIDASYYNIMVQPS